MIKHNKRYQEMTKEYKYPAYLFPNIFFVMFICYNFYSTYNDLQNNDSLHNSSIIQTDLNINKFKSPSENSVNTLSNNEKESQNYNIKKFKFDEHKNESQLIQFQAKVMEVFTKIKDTYALSTEEQAVMNILANDLFGFIKAEDWEALLAFINENVDEHPYLVDGSLNLALIANIPEFVIKELIQYGGKISPMSLLPLILQENFELANILQNYGVDISKPFLDNISMIDIALMTPVSPLAFDYILEHTENITSFKNDLGVDTLGIAIINANMHSTFITKYISKLLQQGVEINEQHLQLMRGLKLESNETFTEIIAGIPHLDPNGS